MTVVGMEQADANRLIEESIDRGVNYFDVAPTYGDSELKYGVALQGHRDSVFLSCKTTKRDAEGARQQLEDSLTRLRTDHVDLYQFHGVSTMEDVAQILAPGGAAEAFLKAREQGKTRFLGFSTHDEDAATALMDGFACDSVLMPVNFVCFEQGGFGPKLLQAAAERRVARLAIKSIALYRRGRDHRQQFPNCWYEPVADREMARLALRFTLSQDVTATVPAGDPELYRMLLDFATEFEPITPEEQGRLMARSKGVEPIFHS